MSEIEADSHRLWGKLVYQDHGEGQDQLFVEDAHECVAEWAEGLQGRRVTLRYWTSTEKATPEEMKRGAVEEMLGLVEDDVGIKHHYSEITGYLWTDENFAVGGHDMITELSSHVGEYLYIEVEGVRFVERSD